jgi:ATP-dependent DNA helicase RecG
MMKGQQSRSEVTGEVTGQVTGEVTGQVTGEVERLVLALEGSMSRAQIQKALSLRHENHFRQPAASTQETRPGCAIPLRAR